MERFLKPVFCGFQKPHLGRRLFLVVVTNFLMGFCVANFRMVGFGTDPMSSASFAFSGITSISMGTWQLVIGLVLFIPVILYDPGKIGIGTLLNMVLLGYVVDFTLWVASGMVSGGEISLTARVILFVFTMPVFLFAVGGYTAADMGLCSYDAIPLILAFHFPKLHFRWIRMAWDISFILLALLLGGTIGLTTLLLAFCLGPAISYVVDRFRKVL